MLSDGADKERFSVAADAAEGGNPAVQNSPSACMNTRLMMFQSLRVCEGGWGVGGVVICGADGGAGPDVRPGQPTRRAWEFQPPAKRAHKIIRPGCFGVNSRDGSLQDANVSLHRYGCKCTTPTPKKTCD